MNPRLEALIILWSKALEGGLSADENARLAALMEDSALMEEFSQWQAQQALQEPESSLQPKDWEQLDSRVKSGFRRFARPLWARPALWLLAAAAIGSAGILAVNSGKAPQNYYEE